MNARAAVVDPASSGVAESVVSEAATHSQCCHSTCAATAKPYAPDSSLALPLASLMTLPSDGWCRAGVDGATSRRPEGAVSGIGAPPEGQRGRANASHLEGRWLRRSA